MGSHPAVKETRSNRIGIELKFVNLISLSKLFIVAVYGNCKISDQTYIAAVSVARRVLQCRRSSVRLRETNGNVCLIRKYTILTRVHIFLLGYRGKITNLNPSPI